MNIYATKYELSFFRSGNPHRDFVFSVEMISTTNNYKTIYSLVKIKNRNRIDKISFYNFNYVLLLHKYPQKNANFRQCSFYLRFKIIKMKIIKACRQSCQLILHLISKWWTKNRYEINDIIKQIDHWKYIKRSNSNF